jgi:septum formation protein
MAEKMRVGSDDPSFTLLVCPDPERKNWRAPSELRGRPIGLVPSEDGVSLVFADGVVTRVRDREGVLEKTVQRVAAQPLISVVTDGKDLIGLGRTKGTFQLYRLVESRWEALGPPCKVVGRVQRPQLTCFGGNPALLWIRSSSTEEDPAMSAGTTLAGRILVKEEWQRLTPAPEACRVSDMIPLPDGVALQLYGVDLSVPSLKPVHALSRWRLNDGVWTSQPSFSLKEAAGDSTGYEVILGRDGKKVVGVLTGGGQIKFFFVDGDATGTARVLAGKAVASAQDELLVFFLLSLVFLAIGVGRILRQRRAKREGKATPQGSPEPVMLKTPQGLVPVDTGAGGLASPMERALALAIDYVIVMPAPLMYLRALKVDFGRTVQDLSAGISPPVSMLEALQESFAVFLVVYIFYATLFEMLTGATLGKRVFGLSIRGVEGGRPPAFRVVLRNMLRPIDHWSLPISGMPILFFPALVSMIFSRFNQRVGDRLGGTMVVRKVPIGERELILASSSPRRQVILKEMGLDYTVVPPEVDESMPFAAGPEEAVLQVAQRKAEAVGNKLTGSEIVLAADTIVVRDRDILGKPRDREHAREILASLSGRSHQVITAVAIWDRMTGRRLSACEQTEIRMREVSPEEIDAYVETGEPDDKAGAYAIQGGAGAFINGVNGSSSNVVGLPAEMTHALLESLET